MPLQNVPTLLIGLIVSFYWSYVGYMVWRVRRDAGNVGKVMVPEQRREKLMWILWVPVIAEWGSTPLRVVLGLGHANCIVGVIALAYQHVFRALGKRRIFVDDAVGRLHPAGPSDDLRCKTQRTQLISDLIQPGRI